MHWVHDKLEAVSARFWNQNPSIYLACTSWGVGIIFLHQFLISTALLVALWLCARHEGWRKGFYQHYQPPAGRQDRAA